MIVRRQIKSGYGQSFVITLFLCSYPGPSTTQTLTTIGLKLGGRGLAIKALLLWCLPGAFLMTLLALSPWVQSKNIIFMSPLVLAFMLFGTFSMFQWFEKTTFNLGIFWISGILAFVFSSPWLYPIGMLFVGLLSAKWGTAPTQATPLNRNQIKWGNITWFLGIFLIIGFTANILTKSSQNSQWAKPLLLFENTYRLSSLSLGGGHVLAAMSIEQYVHHTERLSMNELNTGIAAVQAIPGPNFNLATYTNTLTMKRFGFELQGQLLGALIGMIAVFLPGTLFVFFAFPIWEKIKFIGFIQRSVPALFTLSVGFILSATLNIAENTAYQWMYSDLNSKYLQLGIFAFAMLSLVSRKVPTPLIVATVVIVSWIFG